MRLATMRQRRLATLGLGLALCLGSVGCSNLTVTRINSDEDKPNNVWVFFTVEEKDEPVAGLTADDFQIYEDEKLVSKFESQQTIQNPEVAAVMYTLLLLDMSGSVTESGESDALVDAAEKFMQRMEDTPQKVGVYAFDGSEDVKSVVRFTEAAASIEGGLEGLRVYKAEDPSTNLNGAVVQGMEVLDEALQKDKRPLKFGTLVVFSDGTDRAGRVTEEEMLDTINDEKYADFEIYGIGVGAELEEGALGKIGRDGTEMATDEEKVGEAFDKVAARIEAQSKRFYLLSYCSPSRSGDHAVRIEAVKRDTKGRKKGTGSLDYEFSAEGFGPPPECDPNRAPTFRLDKNLQPAGEESDDREASSSRSRGSAKASGSSSSGGGSAKAKGGVRFGKPVRGPGSGG